MTGLHVGLFLAGLALSFYLCLLYCRRQILRLPDKEIAEKLLRGEI